MDVNEKPAKMPPIDRIAALFASPAKLMENLKYFPGGFIPILVCFVIAILFLPLNGRLSQMSFELSVPTLRTMYENMGLDAEMFIEQARTQAGMSVTLVAMTLVMIPLAAFFSALGMLLVGKIFRSEMNLKQYFSVYAYLQIILTLCGVAVTALSLATHSLSNMLSLGALVPASGEAVAAAADYISMALTEISLPNIWAGILAVIAFKVINNWKLQKSIAAVVTGFALSVAAGVLLILLSSTITGAFTGM